MVSINTNVPSLRADREISKATRNLNSNFQRLSSGKRIESPSTDPAALAIALQLFNEASTGVVAARNISDGVSIANIADGALDSASQITTRLSELATQSANGTLTDSQRGVLNQEYQALSQELDRISNTTEFNDIQLLQGGASIGIQAGTDGSSNSQIGLTLPGVSAASLGLATDISTQANARAAIDEVKGAVETLAAARGQIGSTVSRLDTAFENTRTSEVANRAAYSRIADVDVAEEASRLTANQIRLQSALAVKAQANFQPSLALKLLG